MPITGRVNGNSRRITVRINVSGDAEEYREMVFEVDTASDVEIALPAQDIAELRLELVGGSNFRLNGASYERPRHVAYVEWHGGSIAVNVVETERPPYVGMGLLWDSYLSAYLSPNGAVDVNRMVHWDELKREAEEE